MTGTYAKVVADSVTATDAAVRLITFEVRFPRFVLAEFNTHRVLSRNSASSRAIPFDKQVERLLEDAAVPAEWPSEQKGMQGGESISERAQVEAEMIWLDAKQDTIVKATRLRHLGQDGKERVHKSVVNRLLEPHMQHTVVVTATAWANFFEQRCSPLAQPEIRIAAEMMREAMDESHPRIMHPGEWHLPYVSDDQFACEWAAANSPEDDLPTYYRLLAEISSARCAGVSYLSQGSTDRDPQRDLEVVYKRLTTSQPPHWSPLEHPATPDPGNRQSGTYEWYDTLADIDRVIDLSHLPKTGNLLAWRSLRTVVEIEQGAVTFR